EISFEAMPVDHSIYGATGYLFNAGGTTVAYTGDLRLHGRRQAETEAYINRLAEMRPDYLIIEGTNVGQAKGNDSDTGKRVSEDDAFKNSLEAVQAAEGDIVVADFGPRNIDRLEVFLEIAKATGRRLVITPKDAYLLYAMHTVDSALPDVFTDDSIRVFDAPKARNDAWEKNFLKPNIGSKYVTASAISADPGKHIIAFSFFDLPQMLDVKVPGGIYIYSTCEAFNEDMMADVWRLSHWLEHLRLRPVGFCIEVDEKDPQKSKIVFTRGYHASGHVSQHELAELFSRVKPGAVIPIHTEHPEMFSELIPAGTRLILPEQGVPISLS
ncbi:MAG: ribonuclease J, partial [Actinomycetota bacterium]